MAREAHRSGDFLSMHSAQCIRRSLAGRSLLLACFALVLSGKALQAQNCSCATLQPFGSCTEGKANYPDAFPGAVLVVPRQGESTLLFVADFYSGFTYLYDASRFATATPTQLTSPRGSNSTTGLAFKQEGASTTLFWAVEDRILSSNLQLQDVRDLGAVDLDRLAELLRTATGDASIVRGRLGGITYHKSRQKLWGVDIENDVYFEFQENGQLSLEDGKPVYFFSPRRTSAAGGAYGNSITYVQSGGADYFDIPVGSLADRRPSEVLRVAATASEGQRIGQGAGVFYQLGAALGTPKWITGISFWPASCAADQSSEILLNLDTVGGTPTILQVAADEPTAATVADFVCVSEAQTEVKLTWTKTRPYTKLSITRKNVSRPTAPVVTVYENADFNADPQTFTDRGVLDGSYEYTATVTAASAVPTVSCRITLGVGIVSATGDFPGTGGSSSPEPYAIAVVNNETVIVADLNTGDAILYDPDLKQKGTLEGPISAGKTVGLAWEKDNNRLVWIESDNGKHYLHVTELGGLRVGVRAAIDAPLNLSKGNALAEIAQDPVKKYFWTVDTKNKAIYPLNLDGTIPQEFKNNQIPSPEPTGILGGGVAVSAADDSSVNLDFPLGQSAAGVVDQIARFQFTRANLSAKKEVLRLDLRGTTGASEFGGCDLLTKSAEESYHYVVGVDTHTIYRLNLTSPTSGLAAFRRGDINNDAALNISDPSYLLGFLFKGGAAPACLQAADSDDNGAVDISDAVSLFGYLFKGGAAPPAPFAACGIDLSSPLTCGAATCVDA